MLRSLIISICFFVIVSGFAQQSPKKENAFKPGEKLTYRAYYGWITGANAVLELKETDLEQKKVYYARATGKTVGWIDNLYEVTEVFESYFDKETTLPYQAIEDVKEGDYTRYHLFKFYHSEKKLWSKKSGDKKITAETFDIISAFYFLRNKDLSTIKNNDLIKIKTYFQDEPWDLVIRFKGYENVNLEMGKVRCMKFIPLVQKAGVFKDEEALSIWISADSNRVPVRAQMDLMVGSFKIDLIAHSGLKYEFKTDK